MEKYGKITHICASNQNFIHLMMHDSECKSEFLFSEIEKYFVIS